MSSTATSSWPSPAQDYYDGPSSLDARYLRRPSCFLVRAAGPLRREGISAGDILIVDRAVEPYPGAVLVVVVDGIHTVAVLEQAAGRVVLAADAGQLTWTREIVRWGVVIAAVHDLTGSR